MGIVSNPQRNRLSAALDEDRVKALNPRAGRYLEVSKLYREADGRCAICGTTKTAKRNHSLDHCHKTNKLRGILCHKCNVGLGQFDDDIERLRAAISYLER